MIPLLLTMAHLSTRPMITPGEVWKDTDGARIQAHGGGILLRGKTYYWYGENKSEGYFNKVGVSCYASEDLANWRNLGVVMPKAEFPEMFTEKGVCERPKVIYNARTKQYVMWMHCDANGYGVSEAGVAVSSRPEGPFKWLYSFRPVRSGTFRDMNLFVDDDGTAYAFYSSEENKTMHVVKLNREYTGLEGPLVEGKNFARIFVDKWREAPAPFKANGRYYVVTSGCTGWDPNPADVAVADSIFGPYRSLGNPCQGPGANTTFQSQSTFVLPMPGNPEKFIYMGDRWNRHDLADSRYIWLPMQVQGESVRIENVSSWLSPLPTKVK